MTLVLASSAEGAKLVIESFVTVSLTRSSMVLDDSDDNGPSACDSPRRHKTSRAFLSTMFEPEECRTCMLSLGIEREDQSCL